MWEILDAVWYVLENPVQPGECVVLDSLWRKLSPLWLSETEARAFLEALPAASEMRVTALQTLVLKETYLAALALLGVSHAAFGYQPGQPQARVLELAQLYKRLTQQLHSA